MREIDKRFRDFEYDVRSLFFGFIEAVEGLDESFCDCDGENGTHEKQCMTSLFRLDVASLEAKYDSLQDKYMEAFKIKKLCDCQIINGEKIQGNNCSAFHAKVTTAQPNKNKSKTKINEGNQPPNVKESSDEQ